MLFVCRQFPTSVKQEKQSPVLTTLILWSNKSSLMMLVLCLLAVTIKII